MVTHSDKLNKAISSLEAHANDIESHSKVLLHISEIIESLRELESKVSDISDSSANNISHQRETDTQLKNNYDQLNEEVRERFVELKNQIREFAELSNSSNEKYTEQLLSSINETESRLKSSINQDIHVLNDKVSKLIAYTEQSQKDAEQTTEVFMSKIGFIKILGIVNFLAIMVIAAYAFIPK